MGFSTILTPYQQTGYFSSLVTDFLSGAQALRPFYQYDSRDPDFSLAIQRRKAYSTDRTSLVSSLIRQYEGISLEGPVGDNIRSLAGEDTFTVCTAHQPNLFTGYLYFVYKILQVIRLAEVLKSRYPCYHFVPVYFMGSEDADLQELNRIHLNGGELIWETGQTGPVGRMTPSGIEPLLNRVRLAVAGEPFAGLLVERLEAAYLGQGNIQQATLRLVHSLFADRGLVTIIPDDAGFKEQIRDILQEELFLRPSAPIVEATIARMGGRYPAQAKPREINLFYLMDQLRERIVWENERWHVLNTDISFDRKSLEKELADHPERFSPNVILRGIFQEKILPNLAFVGGGGELAYWMELKDLFAHFGVPYPILLLRNSVLWVDAANHSRLNKTGLPIQDLFEKTEALITRFVKERAGSDLGLVREKEEMSQLFDRVGTMASGIDPTLVEAVKAQFAKAAKALDKVALKLLRAEKKKMTVDTDRIRALRERLFPGGSLQERVENFIPYYSKYGTRFFDILLESLDPLAGQFTILMED